MARIAVIYHSSWGHTASLAKAVVRGAEKVPGVSVKLFTADEATRNLDALDSFDAMIFGCPTYMGSAAAEFKKFMEVSSKKWTALNWKDKIAAGFTNSTCYSGDKLSTLVQLVIFAAQHGMIWVTLGMNPPHTTQGSGLPPDRWNWVIDEGTADISSPIDNPVEITATTPGTVVVQADNEYVDVGGVTVLPAICTFEVVAPTEE